MRRTLRSVHKYLSLALLSFWLLQALTGIFLVFHRELDDLVTGQPPRPLDAAQLERSVERLQEANAQSRVTSIYLTSGQGRNFDISLEDQAGDVQIVRMDGEGRILLRRPLEGPITQGGIYILANRFHRTLAAGDLGGWIVGISGILLLTNLIIAIRVGAEGTAAFAAG